MTFKQPSERKGEKREKRGQACKYANESDNNPLFSITTNSPSAGGLQNISYGYDNIGSITGITDYLDSTRNQTFTYDDLNRLTQAQRTSYETLTYSYNPAHK